MRSVLEIQQAIPNEINDFFKKICNENAVLASTENTLVYRATESPLSISVSSRRGYHIDVEGSLSQEQLEKGRSAIETLLDALKKNSEFYSIWVNFPLPHDVRLFTLLPDCFRIGERGKCDLVYDYQKKKLRIWKWLNDKKACTISSGPNHKMGATALILDRRAKKVLLVVNQERPTAWNLPGGGYDPFLDKRPAGTALREVQEESGLTIENQDQLEPILVGQMEFPLNQFAPSLNQTWAYFINGISQKELQPQAEEIQHAEWVSFEEIEASQGTLKGLTLGEEIKSSLATAIHDRGFERIVNKDKIIIYAPKVLSKAPVLFDSIVSLQELAKYAESLNKDEWGLLVLDLDQTLIQAKPGLGDRHCSSFLRQQHQLHGVADKHIHYHWSVRIREQVQYESCEPSEEINRILQTFRERGWTIKILTSRGLDMEKMTGRHLKESGLDFSLEDVIFKGRHPDGSNKLLTKDESLEQWMRAQPEWDCYKKEKILFVDDLERYCCQITRLPQRLKQIEAICLQYQGCLDHPELSETQKQLFAVQLHALQKNEPLPTSYTETDVTKALQGLNISVAEPEEIYRIMMRMITRDRLEAICLKYQGCLNDPELSETQKQLFAVQLHALQTLPPSYMETDVAKALQDLNISGTEPVELHRIMMRILARDQQAPIP